MEAKNLRSAWRLIGKLVKKKCIRRMYPPLTGVHFVTRATNVRRMYRVAVIVRTRSIQMIYPIHSIMIDRLTIQAGHPGWYSFIEIFGLYFLLLVWYYFFFFYGFATNIYKFLRIGKEKVSRFSPFFVLSFRNLHILAIVDAISTTTKENIITFL